MKKVPFYRTLTAGNGNRTRLPSLGRWCSTNELYLQKMDAMGLEPMTSRV